MLGSFVLALVTGILTPQQIYQQRAPGVVVVFASEGRVKASAGTGSIITEDGKVLTNAHVVAKEGRVLPNTWVYLRPERLRGSTRRDLTRRHAAKVLDVDHALDLALLQIESPPSDLSPIPFGDSDAVQIGSPVVAIGHPETGGLWTLTTGSISAVIADFQGVDGRDAFQTEASVNRGNSGGPLLDAEGHMVGVNTSISRKASDGLAITDINFSIQSLVAQRWLKKHQGVRLAAPSVSPSPRGERAPRARPERPERAPVAPELKEDPAFVARARAAEEGKVEAEPLPPKQLTEKRPYDMESFLAERMEEVRALEGIMEDSRDAIDEKTRRRKRRKETPGLGLW